MPGGHDYGSAATQPSAAEKSNPRLVEALHVEAEPEHGLEGLEGAERVTTLKGRYILEKYFYTIQYN